MPLLNLLAQGWVPALPLYILWEQLLLCPAVLGLRLLVLPSLESLVFTGGTQMALCVILCFQLAAASPQTSAKLSLPQ